MAFEPPDFCLNERPVRRPKSLASVLHNDMLDKQHTAWRDGLYFRGYNFDFDDACERLAKANEEQRERLRKKRGDNSYD